MQIEISTRHGELGSEQQRYLHDKAEKLTQIFRSPDGDRGRGRSRQAALGNRDPGLGRAQARFCRPRRRADPGSGDGSFVFTRSSSSFAVTRKGFRTTKAMSLMAGPLRGRPSITERPEVDAKPIPTRSDLAPAWIDHSRRSPRRRNVARAGLVGSRSGVDGSPARRRLDAGHGSVGWRPVDGGADEAIGFRGT